MIGGSQGHQPFRPHESRLNECGLQKPLFQHMQEKHAIQDFWTQTAVSRHGSGKGGESEREFILLDS